MWIFTFTSSRNHGIRKTDDDCSNARLISHLEIGIDWANLKVIFNKNKTVINLNTTK